MRDFLAAPLRKIRNRFVRDAATLQVSALLNQVSQVLSSVIVAFLLGAHGQGLFVQAVVLQALIYNLISVGIVQATVSQIAAAGVRENHDKVAGWLAFAAKVNILASLALVGLGWWALPKLSLLLFSGTLSGEEARQLGVWSWWLTFWPLIDTPRAVAQVAFQGTRRMLALGQLDNGQELLRAFLVISGAAITGSPAGAVMGEVLSRVASTVLALDLYHAARHDGGTQLPSMRDILLRTPDVPLIRGLRLGLRIGLIKNGTALFYQIFPRLLLGSFASSSAVAYFHVAQRLMGLPMLMMQGVSRTILPALSEARGLSDLARFKSLYTRVSLLSGALIGSAILGALPFIRPVVHALYPEDYVEPVFLFSWILAIGMLPHGFAVGLESFYIVANRIRQYLQIMLAGAIVTIPANVLLIRADPVTGPAWGLVVYMSWVLIHFAYVAGYFRRQSREAVWVH